MKLTISIIQVNEFLDYVLILRFIKQLMVRERNNSSSPPLMLLPQHVSVIRPLSAVV
jgi:hypothetical protein